MTSIRINGQEVPINASLLSIEHEGYLGRGGTRFSSNTPYTLLESSIYKAFTKLFVKEASSTKFNLTVSSPTKSFSVCYVASSVKVTSVGPVVPTIDLELGGKKGVVWSIVGANSMVKVKNKKNNKLDLWCLGFVDSGVDIKTPIVIGAKQLEENLMQFDIGSNKLGFTSLHNSSLKCGNFNVTDFAKK
ncbi:hypothetical protein PIB30_012431 [Stylosanthes scabra]|uniref:Peptidase A1 domain-containing protein n=1 Tax=Stylosanthes scabra TaxID=79078 RepID=A0ABU6S6I4_9FABA|nr:hypothetical protein [Stylosanthes scabra]